MSDPIPVIIQGLGPIGRRIAAAAHADPQLEVVAAVDIDRSLIGRPLADVIEAAAPPCIVRPSLGQARADAARDDAVVLQATGSYLKDVALQVEEALRLSLHVVSTCEELAYPFHRYPALARAIDQAAHAVGRTVVAAGVNPGFLMDQLPVVLRSGSHDVRAITVRRIQNPRRRRAPFQRKVGMDLPRADYDRLAASGTFGHVGLEESGRLIAAGFGWEIDDWQHDSHAVQPDPNGHVLGTLETLHGATAEGRSITLHFEAQAGVDQDLDAIDIDGTPPLHLRFEGGVQGDDATVAAILRCAHVVPSAPRGLATVLDLPLRPRPR